MHLQVLTREEIEAIHTRLGERRPWASWDETGRAGMAGRAHQEAERILATHEVAPLTDEQERELDTILARAEHELSSWYLHRYW